VRILVNFQFRERWTVHCLLEDARTPISPFVSMKQKGTLIRMLLHVGATDSEIDKVEDDMRRWSRGTVHITLTPGRKNLLRIREPWCEGLLPPK
jgi:hypothetical protein